MRRIAPRRTREPPPLVCPSCGARHPANERFCPTCHMPLVHPPGPGLEPAERHRRARKIKPQLAAGDPVVVASARNQAEAELIAGLLLEEGIPSLIRRSAGADVPDLLAAGPRDVLVPQAAEDSARELLNAPALEAPRAAPPRVAAGRLLAGLVIALALGALLIWLLIAAIR